MTNQFLSEGITALVVILLAGLALRLLDRAMAFFDRKQWLPPTVKVLTLGFLRWSIYVVIVFYVLDLLGLPVKSLWSGFLSVALLVAIAFVASWSVLSNILSAVLLLTFSHARMGDIVELKDTKQDEIGIRGKIIDINLFFITIEELFIDENISDQPALVQIPCHLFFFRVTRCWAGVKTQSLMEAFQDDKKSQVEGE